MINNTALNAELNEIHFSDTFPKGFMDFYNRWKKYKNDPELYVRFDNGDSADSLSKLPSNNPTHSDPVGVYAYPIKYVINHPGDIWYGHNSKYIKVIRDKSRKKIILNHLTEWQAKNFLYKVDLYWAYSHAEMHYPERSKGKNAAGKLFLSAVQMDFSKSEAPPRKKFGITPNYKMPTVRTGKEQTSIFLKMGIDCLEDVSKNIKDSIINDREPEQIVWFLPTSYQVVETFRLSDKKEGGNTILNIYKVKRKLAAEIAKVMDDSLIDTDGYSKFWTKRERLIEISDEDVSLDWKMKNLKMGQKPHKMFKTDERHSLHAKIQTERGEFSVFVFSDDKISSAIESAREKYTKLPDVDNGKRFSKKGFEDQEKQARIEWAKKEKEKKEQFIIDGWDRTVDLYNTAAEILGIEKAPEDLKDPEKVDTYSMMLIKGDEKLQAFYPNADMEMVDGYLQICERLKQANITPSRIPEHTLSDASRYIKKINEISFKDFYSEILSESRDEELQQLYKKSEDLFNRLKNIRNSERHYDSPEYQELRREFKKVHDRIEILQDESDPESDVEISSGDGLIDFDYIEKLYNKDRTNYILRRLLNNKTKKWVVDYINLRNEVLKKIIAYTKNIPNVNIEFQKKILVTGDGSGDEKNSVESFFPVVVEVSASKDDDMTISVSLEIDGRFSGVFEGNDEASPETVRLVNKLINPNGKMVKVYGTHGRDVVQKIKETGTLPVDIYVSPDKEYSKGYQDLEGNRETFVGYVNSNSLNQESEVDWKTIEPTEIKNFRYL